MRVPPISSNSEVVRTLPPKENQTQMPTRIWQELSIHHQRQIAQVLAELIRRMSVAKQSQEGPHDDES